MSITTDQSKIFLTVGLMLPSISVDWISKCHLTSAGYSRLIEIIQSVILDVPVIDFFESDPRNDDREYDRLNASLEYYIDDEYIIFRRGKEHMKLSN